jgi:hypothetical protein
MEQVEIVRIDRYAKQCIVAKLGPQCALIDVDDHVPGFVEWKGFLYDAPNPMPVGWNEAMSTACAAWISEECRTGGLRCVGIRTPDLLQPDLFGRENYQAWAMLVQVAFLPETPHYHP